MFKVDKVLTLILCLVIHYLILFVYLITTLFCMLLQCNDTKVTKRISRDKSWHRLSFGISHVQAGLEDPNPERKLVSY